RLRRRMDNSWQASPEYGIRRSRHNARDTDPRDTNRGNPAMTARTTPPFRADHVGSLLRPKELQAARAAWKAGTMSHDALRAVEDRCITSAIAKQEEIGL